jgi:hypothetical protein
MPRILAVTRALFLEYFEKNPWTAGNVVQGNIYMSRVEFSEVLVRHHLGQFLSGQKLNYRSSAYRFHIIMVPDVYDDDSFKQKVSEVMERIGVACSFGRTCNRGESSFRVGSVVGRGHAAEVELIQYCDIEIRCR